MATLYENNSFVRLPSPPLSPYFDFEYFENELGLKKDECKTVNNNDNNLSNSNMIMASPYETPAQISQNDILRKQYYDMMDDGVMINGEMVPYYYALEKLHSIGTKVINKKTKDAIYLRVFEIDKNDFEDYWVQPMFLSLQSFPFYKLFEEVKNNNEQDTIEIEVPSLPSFRYILYYLYTGKLNKLSEFAKLNENNAKGMNENINYLEIDVPNF